jgi:hypothetical protein
MTALSNTCIFTFVNVDAKLCPIPVPTVYPTTYAEDALSACLSAPQKIQGSTGNGRKLNQHKWGGRS